MKKSLDAVLAQVGPDFWDTAGIAEALAGAPTRQDVEQQVREHRLLALTTFDGRTIYPTWQLDRGQVLAGLPAVLAAFAGLPAWSVATWLTSAHDALAGRTPVAALAAGRDDETVAALASRTADGWR